METTTFDETIQKFLHLSFEIHNKAYGSSTNEKLWCTWTNKFMSLYAKANNPEKFYPIFIKFFNENEEYISKKIFEENSEGDIIVNDEWLKELPSIETNKSKSWTPSSSKCRGKIICLDSSNPKLSAYSIPISEIYNCAIKLYKDKGEKDSICKTYPAKFLYLFYKIYLFCLPEHYEIIKSNVKMLEEHLEIITPTKNTSDMGASLGGGLSSIINGVMESAGMKSDKNHGNTIETLINKINTKSNIDAAGKVIGEVMGIFKGETKDGTSAENLAEGISKVVKSETVINAIGGIKTLLTGEAKEASVTEEGDNPEEQE